MDFEDVLWFIKGYGSVITRDRYSDLGYRISGLIIFAGLPVMFTAFACRLSYGDAKKSENEKGEADEIND